jgi:hypothetical protein
MGSGEGTGALRKTVTGFIIVLLVGREGNEF